METAILKTIPFHEVTIDIFVIEYDTWRSRIPKSRVKTELRQILQATHKEVATIRSDMIFVRNELCEKSMDRPYNFLLDIL